MKKTIKQFVYYKDIDDSQLLEIKAIANSYVNTKNYFFSRFSGVNSYKLLFDYKQSIRDVIVKELNDNPDTYNFNLPARHWKNALDEAVSNIKSSWGNIINLTRKNINHDKKLSKNEIHYINYVLKAQVLLHNVLNVIDFEIPESINYKDIDTKKLNRLIRRTVRKYKSNISYSFKKSSFLLDTSMYNYKNIDNNNIIEIQGLTRGERIKLKVNGVDKPFNKSIKVILKDDRVCLHSQIDTKRKEIKVKPRNIEKANNDFDRTIGVDKNYENVIASSNGITYGDGINKLFNAYTDLTVKQEKNRNKLRRLVKELKEKGNNEEKIKRITKHNLGNKKINKQKDRLKEEFKSLINKSLDDFFEIERPTELIVEKLNFTVKKNKKGGYGRKAKHKLNTWCKGYVRERIEYKCYLYNIKLTEINAAGTSQMCSVCGFYEGKRSKDSTFHCSHCGGGLPVHLNSALVIKQRLNDVEIKVTTPVWRVTQILKGRNQRLLETKTGATQTQELLIINNSKGQSESELS